MEYYPFAGLVKSVIPLVGIFVSVVGTIIIPVLLFRARRADQREKILWIRIDAQRKDFENLDKKYERLEGKFEMLYNEHTRIGGSCGR